MPSNGRIKVEPTIVCPMRLDPSNPWHKVLIHSVQAVNWFCRSARQLAGPYGKLEHKFPFGRDAFCNPGRVKLSHQFDAVMAAHESGALFIEVPYRPKPRLRTKPPGLLAVLGANLLLIYILFKVRV